jgi:hypothetical protein
VKQNGGAAEFDKPALFEQREDLAPVVAQQLAEFGVGNVPRGNQEEFLRLVAQEKEIDEVAILCHDYTLLTGGKHHDFGSVVQLSKGRSSV